MNNDKVKQKYNIPIILVKIENFSFDMFNFFWCCT